MIPLILLGSIAAALLLVFAGREFVVGTAERRQAVNAADREASPFAPDESTVAALDRRFRRSRTGGWLERELDVAGVQQPPVVVFGVAVVVSVVAAYVIWHLFAPLLALIGLAGGYLAVRWYLGREQSRRREAFVRQLPELARVMANASYAGLSLPTAVAIAGEELSEPGHTELSRVATRMKFGAPLAVALDELQERVGTRETKVLVSTLIVSSRSGGSLVSALRDIATTLDQRKETRREIQTTLAQVVATSYTVLFLGAVMLLLLNFIEPGTVAEMTTNPIGQIGLVVSGSLFVGGFFLIRFMSRIDT